MADNTIQFGITVDASDATSGLADINSAFESTAQLVTNLWTEANSTVTASFKPIADQAETTATRTKEQMDKAAAAAGALGDVVGIKVPEGMEKMLAESELIGPVLEKAFAPIAVIQLVQWIAQAADELSKFIADTFIYTDADKAAVAQVAQENKVFEELAKRIKDATRAKQLLEATDQATKDKLKLQFQLEDHGGSLAHFREEIKKVDDDISELQKKVGPEETRIDIFEGMTVETKVLSDETQRAITQIDELRNRKKLLFVEAQAAEATEAVGEEQIERDKAAARAAAQQQAAQGFMKSLQDQLTAEKQTHQVSLQEELYFWKSKLAAAAKYPQDYRQIQQTIAGIDQQIFAERAAAAKAAEQKQIEDNERFAVEGLNDVKAQNDAIIKANNEKLAAIEQGYKGDMEVAKIDEQTREKLAEAELAHGKITKNQEVEMVRQAKQQEIAEEIKAWQAIAAIYDNEPKKVAEIENKIRQLKAQERLVDAQASANTAKAEESRWQKQLQQWQDVNKQMQDSYLQMLNSMNSALINFVTTGKFNWQQMATSMISDILKIALQWAESQIAMKVLGISTGKATAAANISASAAQGAAAAGASVAAIPVIGWSMVEAVSGATMSMLSAYDSEIAEYAVGGIVPMTGLARVHAGETILPASMSGKGDFGRALGGVTVVVNQSVSAVDARSFQGTIRQHARMIASEVNRALKVRGAV